MAVQKPPTAPRCPECNGQMKPTSYGYAPGFSEDDPYINMGCIIGGDMVKYACPVCGYLIHDSGDHENPAQLRALASILGLAIGDAIGAPYEFKPPVADDTPITMHYDNNPSPGSWTDDTAMAIAIMQAWIKHGNITSTKAQNELVKIWKEWSQTAPDCGIQTRQVLRGLKDETAEEAKSAAEAIHTNTGRSAGNGSLMRTAPLAFLRLPDAEVAKIVIQISKLTHFDDDAAYACVIWVFAIRHAIRTDQLDFTPGFEFIPEVERTRWESYLKEASEHPPAYFENNGWVVAAFQAAASAVMVGQYDFEKGIEAAVRAGYDTDTVAAIAGSLLGPLTGAQYLPEEWLESLHGWPAFNLEELVNITLEVIEVG